MSTTSHAARAHAVALPSITSLSFGRAGLELRTFFRRREAVVFTFALPMGVEGKQRLLEEPRAEERARRLLAHLEETAGAEEGRHPFPPGFSAN